MRKQLVRIPARLLIVVTVPLWLGIVSNLHAAGLQLYWTDNSGVLTANTLDHVVHDVVTGVGSAYGIDVAGGYVYWTEVDLRQVLRTPVGGGPSTVLVQAPLLASITGVAVDLPQGKLYWTDGDARTISRANLDGSNPQTIVSANFFNPPGWITLDSTAQRMYWTAYPGGIYSANTDGSDVQQIVSLGGDSSVASIAIDSVAHKMYWTDFRLSSISRANLDGTDIEKLLQFPMFTDPKGIDLDLTESKMYWATGAGHNIQRANLDGTNVEDVLTGLDDPLHVIVTIPEPCSALLAVAALVSLAAIGRRSNLTPLAKVD